jgi:hypothetical protein
LAATFHGQVRAKEEFTEGSGLPMAQDNISSFSRGSSNDLVFSKGSGVSSLSTWLDEQLRKPRKGSYLQRIASAEIQRQVTNI